MGIYSKLMRIQGELIAPKGNYNSFGKYKYRSCEDILEALKPVLSACEAALVFTDTLEHIGDRYYIKSTAKLIDIETGETVENTAYAREEDSKKGMDASQITGASSSYARKYALNGMFAIDDTKDADGYNGKPEPVKSNKYTKNEADAVGMNGGDESGCIHLCVSCGSEIKGVDLKDGSFLTGDEYVKKFGGMCPVCYKEKRKAEKETQRVYAAG